MKLVYAKNCDIYYDSKQGMIVFSKRGLNFVLKRSREDMEIIKEIIKLCYDACDIEKIFNLFPEDKRKKYYSFAKLLWQKKILVEDVKEKKSLSPAIMDFLISNYDADETLMQYWTDIKVVFHGCEDIRETMKTYGISCREYSDIKNYRSERLFVGDFSKLQCKKLLNGKSKVLLYRESEGTSYILYMNSYDEEKYERFTSFVWKENSSFYAKKNMIPIHLFMHCSNCIKNAGSPELLCIAGDGSIHSFAIGSLYTETAAYYNRGMMPQTTMKEALMKIEELAKKAPYLVADCNKNNNALRQSPICNYEVVFGNDFGNQSYLVFHESYEVAAVRAFSEGLETVLNNGKGNAWCCGISKEDYYAKGYISLLEERNECYEIVQFDDYIAGRIQYLEEQLNAKLRVYYRPSPVEGIGGIILCDGDGYILYDGRSSYELRANILAAIYQVIGEKQIQKKVETVRKRKVSAEYSVRPSGACLPAERDAHQTIRELQRYFGNMERIIDEKIWAYQVQIQETGMHVGKFYFVR